MDWATAWEVNEVVCQQPQIQITLGQLWNGSRSYQMVTWTDAARTQKTPIRDVRSSRLPVRVGTLEAWRKLNLAGAGRLKQALSRARASTSLWESSDWSCMHEPQVVMRTESTVWAMTICNAYLFTGTVSSDAGRDVGGTNTLKPMTGFKPWSIPTEKFLASDRSPAQHELS